MKKLILILFFELFSGCSLFQSNESNIIRIKGSDTMFLLNRKLAEEFMKENEGLSVHVEAGGTETGIKEVINNSADICGASRPLQPEEIQKFGQQFSTVGMSFLVARDALSIYVNINNPIKDFTIEQIADIFQCRIRNWSEFGGTNTPIQARSRTEASGTYLYFTKHVLKGEPICESIPMMINTKEIIAFVKNNKSSIGYGGVGFADSSIQCSVNGIKPTRENVLNNKYPISRYLRYYTSRKPRGSVKLFIDWVTSKKGQQIVESMGYVPLWK